MVVWQATLHNRTFPQEDFYFINKMHLEAKKSADLDYLSESDVECLDLSINKCKDKSFDELTTMSHGMTWNETAKNRAMSFENILREMGDSEEYVAYISEKLELETEFE